MHLCAMWLVSYERDTTIEIRIAAAIKEKKNSCFAFYLVSEGHLYTGEAIYKLFLFKFFVDKVRTF